jgi:hypothetical protein
MKCPKCGYISFDFNQVCPKCSKDIAVEQAKLHIPSFRPEAPALLGALIGEADDSSTGVAVGASTGIDTNEVDFEDSGTVDSGDLSFEDSGLMDSDELSFDDSGAVDSGEVEFGDSEDLDMGFESEGEPTEGAVSAFDSAELEPSAADVEITSEESVTDFELGGDETSLSMDSGEFPSEEGGAAGTAEPEPSPEGEELEIDLDDLSLDDSGLGEGVEMDEPVAEPEAADTDLESLASELEEVPAPLDAEPLAEEELALDLDAEPPAEEELALDLDAEPPAEEELALDLDAEPVPGGDDEVALDLGDLKIDESGELQVDTGAEALEEIEEGLEADELSLEEAPTEGATPEEIDREEMDIDLDALSAELEGTSGKSGEGGDLSLDLDDLELELDLDEPKPKPS